MKEFGYQGESKVNGAVLKAYLAAFGPYQQRGEQTLCRKFGVEQIEGRPDAWYPLASFFWALGEFQKQFGREFMRKIGQAIFTNAVFPPDIDTLAKAMSMIDTAYYMNHQTAPDEIGHYHWEPLSATSGRMTCDNPYPCHFDFGILETIAKTFCARAKVTHVDDGVCRNRGGDHCTYLVEWEA
jgi:hypothetical protein